MKIKHRKSIGHYIFDSVLGVHDQERDDKQKQLKILEKSRPAESVECDECGKVGIIARCHRKVFFKRCDKPLCKGCAKKTNGKYYCPNHV